MDPEICTKCGKPKSGTGGATITQWISICRCEALAFEAAAAEAEREGYELCLTCGKRVEEKRQGSLTQWIFKENSCRCEFPEVVSSEEYQSQQAHAPFPGVRRINENDDDSKIRVELGALLDEKLKPKEVNKTPFALVTALIIGGVLAVLSAFAVFVAMTPPQSAVQFAASNFDSSIDYEMADRGPAAPVGSVGLKLDGQKITDVQRFMPAAVAGVKAGDRLMKIDGQSVENQPAEEIAQRLMGSYASPVTISLQRDGKDFDVTLVRAEDIYEGLSPKLSAKDYYALGVNDKFRGKANKSRLEFTRASELGDAHIKKLADRQLLAELPREYVAPAAEEINNNAHSLLCVGAYKSAIVQLKDCIERYPNFEWPYLELAMYYYTKQQPDKAEPLLKKLLEINPNMSRAWIAMSLVKDQAGDKAEAGRCLKIALRLNPEARKDKETMTGVSSKQAVLFQEADFRMGVRRRPRRK